MGEAPGLQELQQAMLSFCERASEKKLIDTTELFRTLEPLYQRYGYRTAQREEPQNILLLHDDGVGDFINCSPAIREVRRAYPKAHITLVVPFTCYAMARFCPYVDRVIVDERKCNGSNPISLLRWYMNLAQQLLPMHFDWSFHFTVYGTSVILSYLSGAKRRIGYEIKEAKALAGPFHNDVVQGFVTDFVPSIGHGTHSVYRYLPLVEHFTKRETEDCRPEIWFLEQEAQRWQKDLRQRSPEAVWIAVAIGASDARRHWPIDAYAKLLQHIFDEEKRDVRFIILGGSGDQDDAEALARALPEHKVWNTAGQKSYRESAAALSCCELYLGNDTGLMHAAAAERLPVLSPCCYPADLPMAYNAVPYVHYPYGVPAVFVRPAHALPDCRTSNDIWGCAAHQPHCITQITPDLMLQGYHLLKSMMENDVKELRFLYEMESPTQEGTVIAMEPLDVSRYKLDEKK